MTIGEKIKLHRKLLDLTQTELGEKLGVKKNAVSKWECGRVDDVPSSKIKAMAALFSVQASYLIDDDQREKPTPVSESGLNPIIAQIMDVVCQLTPETQQKCLDYFESLLALQNAVQGSDSPD